MKRWYPWKKRGVVVAIAEGAPDAAAADAITGEERGEEATPPATAAMMEDLASALLVPGAALSYVLADLRRPRRIQWYLDERPGDVVAWLGLHDEDQA